MCITDVCMYALKWCICVSCIRSFIHAHWCFSLQLRCYSLFCYCLFIHRKKIFFFFFSFNFVRQKWIGLLLSWILKHQFIFDDFVSKISYNFVYISKHSRNTNHRINIFYLLCMCLCIAKRCEVLSTTIPTWECKNILTYEMQWYQQHFFFRLIFVWNRSKHE